MMNQQPQLVSANSQNASLVVAGNELLVVEPFKGGVPILQPDVNRPMPAVNMASHQISQGELQLNSTLIENQKLFSIIN